MTTKLQLQCPIRGTLKTKDKSKDGLKPLEEFYRVEAIKHLLSRSYPKENFKIEPVVKKFGSAGRNSLRADFAVLDVPVDSIDTESVEELLEHAVLLCEVKRDSKKQEFVKETQVRPLLDFAKVDTCIALYWDDVDQRVFWTERHGRKRKALEGPLAMLPNFGQDIKLKALIFTDLRQSDSLVDLFGRIENLLHSASIDSDQRYQTILQLLLAKLFDEHAYASRPSEKLDIQDYRALGYAPKAALETFNKVVDRAISYYQKHLPRQVAKRLSDKVKADLLCDVAEILAPIKLIASSREVIQTFYMKFAKDVYKWDLAQYFTPPPVTDYIVEILNPQFGEHMKDPACGSADFLTAAYHRLRGTDPNYSDCIWGADNSRNAVQVAILNMLLNGDGKSNIKDEDSLELVARDADSYDIMVCNPPFGIRIVEKRKSVLRQFDLGHDWALDKKANSSVKKKSLVAAQETGLLFAELCVRQAKPGGRVGIIVPNGYLGNRSQRYRLLREWLLRNCRVAAICSFPRFTFKTSGADVSASVLYLERRDEPLDSLEDCEDYRFSVQMIERVGWDVGNKRATPVFQRNQDDGSLIVDEGGKHPIDADFESSLTDLRHSEACSDFPWLSKGGASGTGSGWSVSISDVISDADLTLDPKRHCRKVALIRSEITKSDHFTLGDLVSFLPEKKTAAGKTVAAMTSKSYGYVELQDIGYGDFRAVDLRGWQLPARARHFAEPGDIYAGSIWGSVAKWCLIPDSAKNVVVTNGCFRMRMKAGRTQFLPDLLSFMCSEAYAVQMRSLARGSDGLAEITDDDASSVVIPNLCEAERLKLGAIVQALTDGTPDFRSKVDLLAASGELALPRPELRPSHVVLV